MQESLVDRVLNSLELAQKRHRFVQVVSLFLGFGEVFRKAGGEGFLLEEISTHLFHGSLNGILELKSVAHLELHLSNLVLIRVLNPSDSLLQPLGLTLDLLQRLLLVVRAFLGL